MKLQIRLLFSVFFFLALFCFRFLSFTQDIHFSLVNLPPEAEYARISGMTQDQQGYLWLATANGLYKYDGYQYTSYLSQPLNPNSLESNYIECIAAAKDGSIWIGHNPVPGLERLDPQTGIFTHFHHLENDPSSIACDTVAAILQDHEGTIWIGTRHGLDKYDGKTNKFIHYGHIPNDRSSLSYDGVRVIYEDKQGTIWVGTGVPFYSETAGNEGGLNKLNRQTGKFTRYLHDENDPHSLTDNRIRALFEDSHGNFWVGTAGDGLHIMNKEKGTFERYPFDPAHPDKLSRPPVQHTISYAIDHITFITEDNKGRIWIGTFEGGINVWDPSTQKITYYGNDIKSKEALKDESFWAGYKTNDGTIWISTWFDTANHNLYKVDPYEAKVPYEYVGKETNAFTEDNANTLWMGTVQGLIGKYPDGKTQQILLDKDTFGVKNSVNSIAKNNLNQIWLGTSGGLYLFDPLTYHLTQYHHENGNANSLPSETVLIVKADADTGLWLGTNNGLAWMNTKTGVFKNYLHDADDSNSISSNFVVGICAESADNVWIGTNRGLNRLDKKTGHFKKYFSELPIICAVKDREGNFWAAPNQGGLTRYDKQQDAFLNYTDSTGSLTAGVQVFDIIEDNSKNLWLNTTKGIVKLRFETGEATLFGKNQGVDGRNLTYIGYLRNNGDVLYGDNSGYFYFNDKQLQRNAPPPVINITNFSLTNAVSDTSGKNVLRSINGSKNIQLSYKQNTFSFRFATIDFISAHEDTHTLYMLQNYDNNWHLANEEKTAYYFNVPPGYYVFKVKASNSFGIWAEKDIAVTIKPPWYSTWWAYCIYGICFVLIAFFANRIIRNRIIEKERMKSREKELAQAKEIEKAYQELKATQAQLIQSEKMASLGELTAGIAHEIQNPLNFVNNFSEVNKELVDELQQEARSGNAEEVIAISNDIKDNSEKINYHGKRADSIVKGMLQHSRASSGQKEPTDINKLADEYLRLSYHGMRAKDKSFTAEYKTDFDEAIEKINVVPQDIGRVLLNLYNNAFYAVNEKSKNIGSLQPDQSSSYVPTVPRVPRVPTVTIVTKKLNNKIEIRVEDNGNGIPQKVVDKIFQPFFTTKPTGQGTGLGLSLAYDIVKAHGGEIKVETKEGEGSEFIIQLPMK
jgi:ligand-binding sensor domain-containing protein/signal transduction histidine kinase